MLENAPALQADAAAALRAMGVRCYVGVPLIARDELLGTLAFATAKRTELRNPLAPIRNAVEVLKLAAPDNAGVSRASEIIDRRVTYLARLVDDLLDVARIARGKLALKNERVDLQAVVHQAIENLVSNAAKFTSAGGRIEVILDRADDNAVVRVRDNGRGMDAATLANVFDMFYQGTRESDRSVAGLGIGFALVRSLVALHRGQVEASSEGRGRGSEFIVRLPCVGNAAPADLAMREGESGPFRVLVDDDHNAADTTASLLERQGSVATSGYDCEEAVEPAIALRRDIMLLDAAG